jgi:primosomal protein N' (replication factor Y)
MIILNLALPTPLRRRFDYLAPSDCDPQQLQPGLRVKVPFGTGKRQLVGIILAITDQSDIEPSKLKTALAILDTTPVLNKSLLELLNWTANYYHHPLGEVIYTALPRLLRQGQAAKIQSKQNYQISMLGTAALQKKTKLIRQHALLELLAQHSQGLSYSQLSHAGFRNTTLVALEKKNWIVANETTVTYENIIDPHTALKLNAAQQKAIHSIIAQTTFKTFLLDGVTGSGKTEVYLQVIASILKAGKQALVLVPEIGLTPQTVSRFSQRFKVPIVVLHSGLTDQERADAWLSAKQNLPQVVIGTRSAIFTPLPNPGVIILDEVHDPSFKQQSGLRYSARDLAIMRGQLAQCPVILGSATPNLENLHNTQAKGFQHLVLPERAGNAIHPQFNVIDMRNQKLVEGLSPTLLRAITQHLKLGNQVLLFLNRRGFAPVLLCHSCGWSATCKRCDAKMILHQKPTRLYCHHCDFNQPVTQSCAACNSQPLLPVGLGTERLEETLQKLFPQENIIRLDRDNIQTKESLHQALEKIHSGESRILLGTQMLAKGHHFPNVTLVAIIHGDSGLYSADFRGIERMGQLILQVAGRAGRAEKPGEVFIQTHNPNHPLLLQLIHQGYAEFAKTLLEERRTTRLPPFSYLALIRADALEPKAAIQFLQEIKNGATQINANLINVLGPVPALMERKAGRFRAQLLLQSEQRNNLHRMLKSLVPWIETLKTAKKVRWTLDVDPIEL